MKIRNILSLFLKSEQSSGIFLILSTVVALVFANTIFADAYHHLVHTRLLVGHNLEFWVNDGLMAVFFLLVGLEIKREMVVGELREIRNATLPFMAAIGGMLIPALIHFMFNKGLAGQNGWGIPMATDIAFSLGILSLLGRRVPASLKIFLTAFAIIDDLGAILVIAFFYSQSIQWLYLGIALMLFLGMLYMNWRKIRVLWPYIIGGIFMWYFMLESGIHATLAGVLLAICIPFGYGGRLSPSGRVMHALHLPVTMIILPIFAFANTGIHLDSSWAHDILTPESLGISLGLILGKPIGICLFAFLGLWLGWCKIPRRSKKIHMLGVGLLGGIGFTMSIFISILAYDQKSLIDTSKIAILIGSLIAGVLGYILLHLTLKPQPHNTQES